MPILPHRLTPAPLGPWKSATEAAKPRKAHIGMSRNAKGGVVECSRLSRVGGIPAFLRLTLLFTPDKCDGLRNQPGPTVTPHWGQEYARSRGNYSTTVASTLPPMPCCLIKRSLLRGLRLARRCQENQLPGTHQAACRSRLLPYLSVLDFGLTIMSVNEQAVDLARRGLLSCTMLVLCIL
ncbi:hypothetical protein LX32DRAFT_360519 [Colletotrichum zoysiae]|uniref:Uncharacterized protein n=1 Tax=Colletotrichum zoysiae TaxID=1216348 RepID=A0AAD9M0F1_9PEZI|nr:hypothetical protein LX32DRAFT_360519 [Colletotrichum zoysiae]